MTFHADVTPVPLMEHGRHCAWNIYCAAKQSAPELVFGYGHMTHVGHSKRHIWLAGIRVTPPDDGTFADTGPRW